MALCVSRFEWVNLPPTIDETMMEMFLFLDGKAVFFKDEVLGYLCLQTMQEGAFNVYRIPKKNKAYAVNGYNQNLNIKNSVIIYNDVLRNNSMLDCQMYAQRLYNMERTIDVNVNAQKTPVVILCNDNQRLTMENLYMKYEGNQPFIFGNDKLEVDKVSVLKTDAPFISKELNELKCDYWNQALSHFGIVNVNEDKRERLISSEVEQGNSNVIAQRDIWLNPRKQACKKINEMFGLNISVRFRESEVKNDGELYNPSKDNLRGE